MRKSVFIAIFLSVFLGQQVVAAKPGTVTNTVITFSEFPTGTSITDQYSSMGIVFAGDSPFITTDISNPTSPVLSGSPLFDGAIVGKFVNPKTGKPKTVNRFELDAGYFDSTKSTRLTWYDDQGNEIGHLANTALGIQHFIIKAPNIASWRIGIIGTEPAGYAVDNVAFNIEGSSCGDDRDTIIAEYKTYNIELTPLCTNFTQSAGSAYYSFSQLDTSNFPDWALIREPVVAPSYWGFGLDAWTLDIGSVHNINSAYRDPTRNASVGGAPQSRHVYGDAVDLQNISRTKKEYKMLKSAALVANADFIEPFTGPCGSGCVHADWRNHGGPYTN